jgi:hypothetical protein
MCVVPGPSGMLITCMFLRFVYWQRLEESNFVSLFSRWLQNG